MARTYSIGAGLSPSQTSWKGPISHGYYRYDEEMYSGVCERKLCLTGNTAAFFLILLSLSHSLARSCSLDWLHPLFFCCPGRNRAGGEVEGLPQHVAAAGGQGERSHAAHFSYPRMFGHQPGLVWTARWLRPPNTPPLDQNGGGRGLSRRSRQPNLSEPFHPSQRIFFSVFAWCVYYMTACGRCDMYGVAFVDTAIPSPLLLVMVVMVPMVGPMVVMGETRKTEYRHYGLELVEGKVRDNLACGVVEPAISKIKSFRFATEAAITILRIGKSCVPLPFFSARNNTPHLLLPRRLPRVLRFKNCCMLCCFGALE